MAYAVVRTDKLTGTDDRARLVSVRYQPVDSTSNENVATEIENGNFVLLAGLEDGAREIYVGVEPTASSALTEVVLIASPEVMYDERKKSEYMFCSGNPRTIATPIQSRFNPGPFPRDNTIYETFFHIFFILKFLVCYIFVVTIWQFDNFTCPFCPFCPYCPFCLFSNSPFANPT